MSSASPNQPSQAVAQAAIAPEQPRFYCPELPHPRFGEAVCRLDGEQSRHARKVLRLKTGDALELFDGKGGLATAKLLAYDGQQARCEVQQTQFHQQPMPRLTVATAIPKGPLAEAMAQQLSQLGVDRLVPLRTERSVVHPRSQKRERFEKAAIESAKQSGRLFLITLDELYTLDQALAALADLKLVLTPTGETREPDRDALDRAHHVMLLIGPEGGFTDSELNAIEQARATAWSIGPTVLRIETAAAAAAAITRYLVGSA